MAELQKKLASPKPPQPTLADLLAARPEFQHSLSYNPISRYGFDPRAVSVAPDAAGFRTNLGDAVGYYAQQMPSALLDMMRKINISGPGASRPQDAMLIAGDTGGQFPAIVRHESVHRAFGLMGEDPKYKTKGGVELDDEDLTRLMDFIFSNPEQGEAVKKYFAKKGLNAVDLVSDFGVLEYLQKMAMEAQGRIGDGRTLMTPEGSRD